MVKELVTFVVRQLVSYPDQVMITIAPKESSELIEIKVAPEDRGRVIGKEGHTIKALRILIDAVQKDKKSLLELSR
jgi:predicted RNA-binding protein YlqC (UPF0109 family)